MPLDMVCNFRKCRRPLTTQAWVTTCSHAFCIEHGKREFKRNAENSLTCPACSSELRDKFDVIQADLDPSDTFKSIVLAGMRPDTIMDVAMRAMSFWSYQVEQETLYQENLAKHTSEKLQCIEEINTLNLQKLKAELDTCKRKVLSMQSEYNKKRKQVDELTACLEDKSRKIQKLNFQLETQKRKGIHTNDYERKNDMTTDDCLNVSRLVRRAPSTDRFVFRPMKDMKAPEVLRPPKSPVFDFHDRSRDNSTFRFRPLSS